MRARWLSLAEAGITCSRLHADGLVSCRQEGWGGANGKDAVFTDLPVRFVHSYDDLRHHMTRASVTMCRDGGVKVRLHERACCFFFKNSLL